ncbi:hypothetical protein [Larsenimonas suaedae]|uniref:DUF3616 domain-containing protein n=1 Tax=Larsenimonas suaedae TaxID=1851019 RepID=A0ABU1GW89_9GAMM|nr:hypothetical protein [Larsenimonas suaedae]MCM2973422.1 hypothetical protein [Larsenimonas suaedae]MDR5896315.1 hypothetical protein [Larsenimonas suaedae]
MSVDIKAHGVLHCFEPGLKDDDGELVNAEISAVAFDGHRLLMASDKPIPGKHRSAVFAVALEDHHPLEESLEYLTAPLIKQAIKYEDFALTVDGRYMIATTGFDRIDAESHALNDYNHLLIWPLEDASAVKVVDPDPRNDIYGSLELRQKLTDAIGTPYYKIEGLATVPGDQGDGMLLFGVREQGTHFDDFEYVARIVGAPYRVTEQGALEFVSPLTSIYRFEPEAETDVRFECGLSSLEYDPFNERLYLLTSFEVEDDSGERIGGYLWSLTLEAFQRGEAPELCRTREGTALEFEHKAEGLAVLDASTLFVAYDNDRDMALRSASERDERYASETPYTLLRVSM